MKHNDDVNGLMALYKIYLCYAFIKLGKEHNAH